MVSGPEKDSDRKVWIRGLALLAWVSWEVLGWGALGTAAGYFMGRALGGAAWLGAVTGALGLAIAFWRIYQASQTLDDEP